MSLPTNGDCARDPPSPGHIVAARHSAVAMIKPALFWTLARRSAGRAMNGWRSGSALRRKHAATLPENHRPCVIGRYLVRTTMWLVRQMPRQLSCIRSTDRGTHSVDVAANTKIRRRLSSVGRHDERSCSEYLIHSHSCLCCIHRCQPASPRQFFDSCRAYWLGLPTAGPRQISTERPYMPCIMVFEPGRQSKPLRPARFPGQSIGAVEKSPGTTLLAISPDSAYVSRPMEPNATQGTTPALDEYETPSACASPSTLTPGSKNKLVAWLSGRTSVFGRRTFPVLRSTCS